MRHVRSLGFDNLEERKLLSKLAHHPNVASAHAATAAPAPVSLNINGTVVVDMSAATQTSDDQGDQTTIIPVTGTLGSLGKVHGTWSESTDQFGDYLGPDTIQFATSQGTFTIAFDSANLKNPHKIGKESIFPPLAQQFESGTGIDAKASEMGSIQVILNPSKGVAETMTFVTATPG